MILALEIFNFRFRKSLIFDLIFQLYSHSTFLARWRGPRVEAELRVDGVLEAQPLAAALLPELVEGLHVALRVRRGVRPAALRADRLDRPLPG